MPPHPRIWSNVNAGEVLPGVVSPMMWSIVSGLVDPMLGGLFSALNVRLNRQEPICGLVAGRVYFNATAMEDLMRQIPVLGAMKLDETLGGFQLGGRAAIDLGKLVKVLPGFVAWYWAHRLHAAAPFLRECRRTSARLAAVDLTALDDRELVAFIMDTVDSLRPVAKSVGFSGVAIAHFTNLRWVCRHLLADEDGRLAGTLVAGQGPMASAEAGRRIVDLAREAQQEPRVAAALERAADWGEAERGLRAAGEAGRRFLAGWETFLEEHGHHARRELDVETPRWAESQDELLAIIRGLMHHRVRTDRGREPARLQLEADCRRRLRGPLRRGVFDVTLRAARQGALTRENGKSEAVKRMAILRTALLALGERAMMSGLLAERDEIFFLRIEELDGLFSGDDSRARLVAERRNRKAEHMSITPPPVVQGAVEEAADASRSCRAGGDGDGSVLLFDVVWRPLLDEHGADRPPLQATPDTTEGTSDESRVLNGLGASPGVVEGTACVLLPDDSRAVLPGEILVAPMIDPGWTPYFVAASGVVTDLGGILSHGSIIAREYGVPAVVNTRSASREIRTGDRLRIDGTKGTVQILPHPHGRRSTSSSRLPG